MTRRILPSKARKSKPVKPSKPYADYPLTPHPLGKWCKKVKGVLYYFGEWADPDGALNEWLERQDGIRAGIDHERQNQESSGDDVAFLCNDFLASKLEQVEAQDIEQATYDKYEKTCDRIVEFFGKRRRLDSLDSPDFRRLRGSWPKSWNASSINNEIARVKACLNYGWEAGVVDTPIRTGPNFKRVPKKKLRLERAKKPKKLFTAEEIHGLIDAADVQLKAMILLGINAAYGNADCGRLQIPAIDFERCWLEGLRHKTAVERAAWLWPETIAAVNDAIEQRYDNAPETLADHVFITKRRQAWYRATGKDDAITQAFSKLRTKVLIKPGVKRLIESGESKEKASASAKARWNGVNFYALRHTFETIGGNAKDQIAVNYVMGHCDDSMAAVYREGIDPQRIVDVCSFVRDWWIDGKPTKGGK